MGVALAVGTLCAATPPDKASAERASPDQVEAAYLYNFGKFVRWPGAASQGPLTLCVAGRPAVSGTLSQLATGDQIDGRPLEVRAVERAEQARGCSVLFVSASEGAHLGAWLAATGGQPVLTVGDGQDFLARGGVIQFEMDGNHVRFAVNLNAARKNGLQLSSELLKVAVNVVGQPGGAE